MMGTYHEVLWVNGTEEDDFRTWYDLVVYRQPVHLRWISQGFKVIEKLTAPTLMRWDSYFTARHRATCNQDCGVWVDVDGVEQTACTYWQLSLRQSLYRHRLDHRGRVLIERREISREEAVRQGWPERLDH